MAHIGSERILIITHSYTPFMNPRAFRWSAIAEKWIEQGKKVDVICSWLPGLLRCEIHNGVEIYRVGGGIIERLRSIVRPKSRSTTAHTHSNKSAKNSNRSIKKFVMSPIRFIHDKIWKNIYWPDYACTWIGRAANKALELCSMENYSTVITVSDPFSSHLAGRKVKSHNPQLNWLVDIGDPFCFRHDNPTNNHRLYRKFNYRVENKVFSEADYVSVTTGSTRNKYAEIFTSCAGKIVVVPPMMKETNNSISDDRALGESKRIKLVFVGTLYRSIRNPEYLLQLFITLLSTEIGNSVELHFFGGYDDCSDIFESYLAESGERLVLHGLVNRQKVLNAMSEADVLINIGNDNPFQLPSKVVEYAWMGKPIVNIHTIESDSSKEFLSDYPAILNVNSRSNESIEMKTRQLVKFMNRLPNRVDSNFLNNWRERYSTEAIAEQYLSLINSEPVTESVKV